MFYYLYTTTNLPVVTNSEKVYALEKCQAWKMMIVSTFTRKRRAVDSERSLDWLTLVMISVDNGVERGLACYKVHSTCRYMSSSGVDNWNGCLYYWWGQWPRIGELTRYVQVFAQLKTHTHTPTPFRHTYRWLDTQYCCRDCLTFC